MLSFRVLICAGVASVMSTSFFQMTSASNAESANSVDLELAQEFRRPNRIVFPPDAPYDPSAAVLGKMLFFDPRLSKSQNMSCATCHNPSFGWETPVDKAIGALNSPLKRHAPTVLNLADATQLMWDGRMSTLEAQAAGPITHPMEMGADFPTLVKRLSSISSYNKWFKETYPKRGVSRDTILSALATYERTIQSGWAPFDEWVKGKKDAISESAKNGFAIFTGKANCSACHSGWNFTDHQLHDIGLLTDDLGRGEIEPQNLDVRHSFKTSGLRNITLRAPFMHNGGLNSLSEVIDHYAKGGIRRASKSLLIQPFDISEKEKGDLIAFLETLTEEKLNVAAPVLPIN